MNKKPRYELFGAYNGKAIRSRLYGSHRLINATDLFRATKAPSKHRCDRFRNREDIQTLLKREAKKLGVKPFLNKQGLIAEVEGVFEIVSGGVKDYQGTYFSIELAKLYLTGVSKDCLDWLNHMVSDDKTEVIKVEKVVIELGKIKIDVYEIPNGEYRLSQTQIAEIIKENEISFRRFLRSKSPEALPYKGYKFDRIREKGAVGRPANGVPIKIAGAFWLRESKKNNLIASSLVAACLVESIERRADKAFGKEISEQEYNQRWQKTYQSIIAELPSTFVDKQKSQIQIATFSGNSRKIKKLYPDGVIPGFATKEKIIERLIMLSQYASPNPWELIPGKELFPVVEHGKAKCPDFISNIIETNKEKIVIVFQIFESIISINDLRNCVSRNYSRLAKQQYQVEHSLLLLVSPLGMSQNAKRFLCNEIELEENLAYQKVGVITIKDLASFYYREAIEGKKNTRNINKINNCFAPFLSYQILKEVDKNIQLAIPFASVS